MFEIGHRDTRDCSRGKEVRKKKQHSKHRQLLIFNCFDSSSYFSYFDCEPLDLIDGCRLTAHARHVYANWRTDLPLPDKQTNRKSKKKRVAITSSGAAFGICINWPKTKKKRQTKIGGNYREPNETRRNEKGQWNRSFLRDWRRFPSLSSREVLYNEWREPRGHRCPEQLDVTICLASDKSIWGYMPAAEITNQTTTSFKITLKSFLKKEII